MTPLTPSPPSNPKSRKRQLLSPKKQSELKRSKTIPEDQVLDPTTKPNTPLPLDDFSIFSKNIGASPLPPLPLPPPVPPPVFNHIVRVN